MQIDFKGEYTAIREMRKHAAWYTTGYKNSSKLRARVCEVETYGELEALLEEVLKRIGNENEECLQNS